MFVVFIWAMLIGEIHLFHVCHSLSTLFTLPFHCVVHCTVYMDRRKKNTRICCIHFACHVWISTIKCVLGIFKATAGRQSTQTETIRKCYTFQQGQLLHTTMELNFRLFVNDNDLWKLNSNLVQWNNFFSCFTSKISVWYVILQRDSKNVEFSVYPCIDQPIRWYITYICIWGHQKDLEHCIDQWAWLTFTCGLIVQCWNFLSFGLCAVSFNPIYPL